MNLPFAEAPIFSPIFFPIFSDILVRLCQLKYLNIEAVSYVDKFSCE